MQKPIPEPHVYHPPKFFEKSEKASPISTPIRRGSASYMNVVDSENEEKVEILVDD